MIEQHTNPCRTCPFTKAIAPDLEPGGSPLKVYVAQHFMPFQVPCHECVDYDDDRGEPEHGWKKGAVKQAQCVGFAETRSGGGVAQYMPSASGALLQQDYEESHGAFHDIWDFYAHHKQFTRREALIEVHPQQVMAWCIEELLRSGRFDIQGIQGSTASQSATMANQAATIAEESWKTAMHDEFKRDPRLIRASEYKDPLAKHNPEVKTEDGYFCLGLDYHYTIEMVRCDTPVKLVEWLCHLAGKSWVTATTLRSLADHAATHGGFEVPSLV